MLPLIEWDHATELADIFTFVAAFVFFWAGCCIVTCKLRQVSRNACIMIEVILFVCGGSVWTLRRGIINELASTASVVINVTSAVESVTNNNNVPASW